MAGYMAVSYALCGRHGGAYGSVRERCWMCIIRKSYRRRCCAAGRCAPTSVWSAVIPRIANINWDSASEYATPIDWQFCQICASDLMVWLDRVATEFAICNYYGQASHEYWAYATIQVIITGCKVSFCFSIAIPMNQSSTEWAICTDTIRPSENGTVGWVVSTGS